MSQEEIQQCYQFQVTYNLVKEEYDWIKNSMIGGGIFGIVVGCSAAWSFAEQWTEWYFQIFGFILMLFFIGIPMTFMCAGFPYAAKNSPFWAGGFSIIGLVIFAFCFVIVGLVGTFYTPIKFFEIRKDLKECAEILQECYYPIPTPNNPHPNPMEYRASIGYYNQ